MYGVHPLHMPAHSSNKQLSKCELIVAQRLLVDILPLLYIRCAPEQVLHLSLYALREGRLCEKQPQWLPRPTSRANPDFAR